MDVIDQAFDNRLAVLQAAQAGTNSVAELAFDDRVDGFGVTRWPGRRARSSSRTMCLSA